VESTKKGGPRDVPRSVRVAVRIRRFETTRGSCREIYAGAASGRVLDSQPSTEVVLPEAVIPDGPLGVEIGNCAHRAAVGHNRPWAH
jgi:hypothetical protein